MLEIDKALVIEPGRALNYLACYAPNLGQLERITARIYRVIGLMIASSGRWMGSLVLEYSKLNFQPNELQ